MDQALELQEMSSDDVMSRYHNGGEKNMMVIYENINILLATWLRTCAEELVSMGALWRHLVDFNLIAANIQSLVYIL